MALFDVLPFDPSFLTKIGQPFKGSAHTGIDFLMPTGTPLRATMPGYVTVERSWDLPGHPYAGETHGWAVILHNLDDTVRVIYGHVSQIAVAQGQRVIPGQVIASSGGEPGTPGAGFSSAPHVHFETQRSGVPFDPTADLTAASGAPAGGVHAGHRGASFSPSAGIPGASGGIKDIPVLGGIIGGVEAMYTFFAGLGVIFTARFWKMVGLFALGLVLIGVGILMLKPRDMPTPIPGV